jgi:predicted RNase H-like nuclease
MSKNLRRRGSQLPYELLAGVVSCPGGWLVVSGKLVGINLFPQQPQVVQHLRDVLDTVPGYSVIALAAPVGLPDWPSRGGRACDREARRLLGWPRSGAVRSAPCRMVVDARTELGAVANNGGRLDVVTLRLLPRIKEVASEVQSHRQRTVHEAHPALSFYQLNGDRPLAKPKRRSDGIAERQGLLVKRMPGLEGVLNNPIAGASPWRVLDAAAVLWTARRIAARAVNRVPEQPEWNAEGLRMEIIR